MRRKNRNCLVWYRNQSELLSLGREMFGINISTFSTILRRICVCLAFLAVSSAYFCFVCGLRRLFLERRAAPSRAGVDRFLAQ